MRNLRLGNHGLVPVLALDLSLLRRHKTLIYRLVSASVVLVLCVTLLLRLTWSDHSGSLRVTTTAATLATDEYDVGHLHIVIPASHQSPDICKTTLSAGIAGYPPPVILNWNQSFDDSNLVEGGSHLAKIKGFYEYLASLDSSHDEDLVLMVDGYDVWLQLRPQTLVDRYYSMCERANERLDAKFHQKGSTQTHQIRQEVIFGCQKRCWPWSESDPPCYAVPNSTLPTDYRGDVTDTPGDGERDRYVNYRPRFLVSGTAIGPVRAMRKLYHQALLLAKEEANFGSDQYIISHIFGDQEVFREVVRREARCFRKIDAHPEFPEQHIREVKEKAVSRTDGNYEFGVGLDYAGEIVLNTVFAEDDTDWLTFQDQESVKASLSQHAVPMKYWNPKLPSDIADSLPPYWTFSEENLPRWTKWDEVPLFTNVFTGAQPAVIHHNAHRDGLKSLRETWWPLLWSQRYARTLYDAHVYAPVVPVAISKPEGGVRKHFWPRDFWKGGVRDALRMNTEAGTSDLRESWIRFDDLCRDYHEEVFRDQKGPWVLPENH